MDRREGLSPTGITEGLPQTGIGILSPDHSVRLSELIRTRRLALEGERKKLLERMSDRAMKRDESERKAKNYTGFTGGIRRWFLGLTNGNMPIRLNEMEIEEISEKLRSVVRVLPDLQAGRTDLAEHFLSEEAGKMIPGFGVGVMLDDSSETRRFVREDCFERLLKAIEINEVLGAIDPEKAREVAEQIRKSRDRVQNRLGNIVGNSMPEDLYNY